MIGKVSTAVVAALLAAGAAQAAEFVSNGNFESTNFKGNSEFGASFAGGSRVVTDWTSASTKAYNLLYNAATATTGNADGRYVGTGKEMLWAASASPTGGNFVALDGDIDFSGALTQQIKGLVVGETYTLTFNWAAGQLQSRDGATTEQLRYSIGNNAFSTAVINNPNHGFSGWKSVSQTFKYSGGDGVLSFLSIGTPSGLPPVALLDSVSLTNAVPEPATWAMMIGGFGMIGGALRRRRQDVVAAC